MPKPESPASDDVESVLDWWAAVKYPDGGDELVQVHQFENFLPKDKNDFLYGKKYNVRTSKWNPERKMQRYKGYILRIEESEKAVQESLAQNRGRHPPLKERESDFLTSESEVERKKQRLETNIKRKPSVIAAVKKQAAEKDLEQYLKSMPPPSSHQAKSQVVTSQTLSEPACSSKSSHKLTPRIPPSSHKASDILKNKKTSQSNGKQIPKSSCRTLQAFSNPSTSTEAMKLSVNESSSSFSAFSIGSFNQNPALNKFGSSYIPHAISSSLDSGVDINNVPFAYKTPDGHIKDISDAVSLSDKDQKISSLEKQLEAAKKELLQYKSASRDDLVLQKLSQIETYFTGLAHRVQNLEDESAKKPKVSIRSAFSGCLNKISDSDSTSAIGSSVLSQERDLVHLGNGVTCTPASFTILQSTADFDDWCTALLMGVYSEEAKFYSLNPRSSEKRKFSRDFKTVARDHYTKFLLRNNYKAPFAVTIFNKMLAALSRKARDLNGRRNRGNGEKRTDRSTNSSTTVTEYLLDAETGCLLNIAPQNNAATEHITLGDSEFGDSTSLTEHYDKANNGSESSLESFDNNWLGYDA